ncbi:ABC transporter substrate-binding protein [Clostridia bacterium]|nr:ABC transporter substrate-binding protein [Clostridia bacterium]
MKRWSIAIALLLVLCLAAPAFAVQYSQGADDKQVIIANSAATSGAYAPVGVPFVAGIEAYVKWVNDNGGIDGRQIVYKHVTDDEFDPIKGMAALTTMVEDEKVFALVGHFGTPVVAATLPDIKEYGIPAVYFATGIGQLFSDNATTNETGYNIFPVQPIYTNEGKVMIAYAAGQFEAKKVGVIYTNDDAGISLLQGVEAQATELGIELTTAQVVAGSADVSSAVTTIKTADVDFIVVASIQGTVATIVKELAAQGVNKDCITTYVNVQTVISAAVVDDIQGKFDVYGLGWVGYVEDSQQEALTLYTANIAEEYANNAYAQTGWIAGHFFAEGLRRIAGQDITWENYMKALESEPIRNPFGGYIDFANGQRVGTQEMNLSKVVPVADEFPTGWEIVAPMQSISTLLGK